ncbi:hypothetical protein HBB16_02755 [Pseudonocardia sp. MCCB 268]|nr:hypothetical protein [Pseudonocardia cytotoxica]
MALTEADLEAEIDTGGRRRRRGALDEEQAAGEQRGPERLRAVSPVPGPAVVVGSATRPEWSPRPGTTSVPAPPRWRRCAGGAGRFSVHKRTNTDVAQGRLAGRPVTVAVPRTYYERLRWTGSPACGKVLLGGADELVVVHDDLTSSSVWSGLGAVAARAWGHNGLRSISRSPSNSDHLRVRFGIGRPPSAGSRGLRACRFGAEKKEPRPG